MLKFDNKNFFFKTKHHNIYSFLKFLGIARNSYMAQTFTKLFEHYFANAVSLKKEFRNYYKKEFGVFDSFLCHKYNFFPSEIKDFADNNIYYKDLSVSPDLQVDNLMEDKIIEKAVLDFIRMCEK